MSQARPPARLPRHADGRRTRFSGRSREPDRRWPPALLAVATTLFLSCGESGTDPVPPPAPVATTVSVTPTSAALAAIGETTQLTAEVRDQNGQPMAGAPVAWSSSDPSVAPVDAAGLVTAAGNGTATITATSGSVSGTASATVDQVVDAVTVTPPVDSLVEADTLRLSAAAVDANGHAVAGAEFEWASADTLLAVVDDAGLVTGVAAGEVEITATASGVAGSASVVVLPVVPTTVELTPDSLDFTALGETVQMSAEVRDQLGRAMSGASVAWASSDVAVATVDASGLVTAAGNGTATITATSGSASDEAAVTVAQSVTTVAITPKSAVLLVGDTLRLSAMVLDALGGVVVGAAVTWSSSDFSVATVDDSGLVRAAAQGTATVTAASGNASAAAAITVGTAGTGERAALTALYLATDGPNWRNSTNWLTDAPLGEWYGVTTDASGRVVGLDLGGRVIRHGLSGSIPPELGSLTDLTRLHLGLNNLSGPIPPELGRLANLWELSLSDNDLSGSIPSELGDLPKLRVLRLFSNALSGPIPPELGDLAKLTELRLTLNELSGSIPSELGNLASLKRLHLDGNDISGTIPPELGGLANLTWLTLGSNELAGPIPPELGSLSNLTWLDLAGNDVSGSIPPELGDLTNLELLYLNGNRISGPIPPEIGKLVNLERLHLGSASPRLPAPNDLSGPIPPELGRLANLTELALGSNRLTGRIPPELGSLANLERLYLFDNDLSGPVPPELGDLGRLMVLQLAGTEVCVPGVGRLVRWIGGMDSFTGSYCNESDAAVLGSLYESTGGPDWVNSAHWLGGPALSEWHGVGTDTLGRVTTLDLTGNGLKGELPSTLGRLTELTELRVGDNAALTGRLPVSLARLSLSVLHYAGTDVCSPADDSFRAWLDGVSSHEGSGVECAPLSERDVLTELYRKTDGPNWVNNENWLTDAPLGEWYGVGTDGSGRVVSLDVGGGWDPEARDYVRNGLSGTIPPELAALANLTLLDLGWNELSGYIPPELGRLANLTRLDLGWNELSGPIPPELGSLPYLWRLDLDYNYLTGPVPPELGDLSNLGRLHLDGNDISGRMPPELGGLASLTRLTLGRNELSGPVPPELGSLANLTWLDLAQNDLSGRIPPELGDLASLERLYLGGNRISGPIPPELGNLVNLWYLHLGSASLAFVPAPNDLSGPIPPELGRLANLRELALGSNGLTGRIPPELGDLANLERLHLFDNALSGPVPPEFGGLARLATLSLLNNDLSGSLPSELGRLAGLTELDLTNNAAMSGALPASLTGLRDLQALYARGTGLCAPPGDTGLLAWLRGVPEAQIATCAPAAAHLVQGVQSREFPVPLVAGEEALLRVFITADQGAKAHIPPVRARFHVNGTETYAVDVPGSSVPIPTAVDEGNLSKSVNAVIPGHVVRPGLELVIEVDPDGTLDRGLGVAERIPATGRLAVDVWEMPRFDLTVIPFLWASDPDSSVIRIAEEMAADPGRHGLLAATRTLLPVADIAVTAHSPVTMSSRSGFAVFLETAAILAMEGGDGHYMGMMAEFDDAAGVGSIGGRASASVPHQAVIAHELGHNLSLRHTPCGGGPGPDPRYPHPDGSIGAWGYDFPGEYDLGSGLVPPETPDLMGYCGPPDWISDYHFARALDYRLADEGAPAAPAERSILVWGGVDAEGAPFLEPAFVVDAPPSRPDSGGEYELVGRTPDGGELFSLGFAMPETADADGASAFVFVLPVEPGWASTLASLTLTGPEGEATLDSDTNRPMAILRDPRSGQVRGFLSDLPQANQAAMDAARRVAGPGLEVLFSRGIPDAAAWRR